MVGNRFFGSVLSPSKSGALDITEFDRWMLPEQKSAALSGGSLVIIGRVGPPLEGWLFGGDSSSEETSLKSELEGTQARL
jgi:hypothetical protein